MAMPRQREPRSTRCQVHSRSPTNRVDLGPNTKLSQQAKDISPCDGRSHKAAHSVMKATNGRLNKIRLTLALSPYTKYSPILRSVRFISFNSPPFSSILERKPLNLGRERIKKVNRPFRVTWPRLIIPLPPHPVPNIVFAYTATPPVKSQSAAYRRDDHAQIRPRGHGLRRTLAHA